jgi:hypothetical protein
MPDVQNLDDRLSDSIEDFVGVAHDKHHAHIGIVRSITAVRLITELRDRLAEARGNIPRSTGRALSQIFQNSFAIGKSLRGIADPHDR